VIVALLPADCEGLQGSTVSFEQVKGVQEPDVRRSIKVLYSFYRCRASEYFPRVFNFDQTRLLAIRYGHAFTIRVGGLVN
jgi:hypothetical protein